MEAIVAVAPDHHAASSRPCWCIMKLALGLRVTMYRAQHRSFMPWGDNGDDRAPWLAASVPMPIIPNEVPATLIILALVEMVGVSPLIVGSARRAS